VYGGEAHGKDEDSECHPEGPYAESKWQAERRLIELCQKEGMNLTILRLATLYGEEDPGNVARLIGSIERGRFIWVGKGENLKSLLNREDAAGACVAVIKAPVSGINIYNVSAPPRKMCDIVAAITRALGSSVPSWHVPGSFALNSAKIIKSLSFNRGRLGNVHGTLQKWLADDYYNVDKLCNAFNFQTKVSLEEGIRREVAWYNEKML
jgi:nucleoside-diphosphate-sugar epimerase